MPFTFRGPTANTTNVAGLTTAAPAGTAAGDLMLLLLESGKGPVIPTPAGYTKIGTDVDGTGSRLAMFWKVAVAGEPAAVTSYLSGTDHRYQALFAIRGVDTTTNPVVSIQSGVFSVSSDRVPIELPEITGLTEENLGVYFAGNRRPFNNLFLPSIYEHGLSEQDSKLWGCQTAQGSGGGFIFFASAIPRAILRKLKMFLPQPWIGIDQPWMFVEFKAAGTFPSTGLEIARINEGVVIEDSNTIGRVMVARLVKGIILKVGGAVFSRRRGFMNFVP